MDHIVADFFNRYFRPDERPEKVLVGLSGGADSVALLLALQEVGIKCEASHCNFGLRGDESDADEAFVGDLCRSLGIDLWVVHFDVEARRKETGESIEMACRSLRYEWWESLMQQTGINYLAVGHHLEDNVETLLLNLIRGTGIRGAKGMLPVNGKIIRPLLEVSRKEITDYLARRGFGWVTDSTNAENIYSRNRLRNLVAPVIEEAFPGALEGIARSMAHLRDNYAIFSESVDRVRQKVRLSDGSLDLGRMWREELHPSAMLFELISPLGFKSSQASSIASILSGEGGAARSGQRFVAGEHVWMLDHGILSLDHSETSLSEVSGPLESLPLTVERITRTEFDTLRRSGTLGREVICLDAACLDEALPWTLRGWRAGDRLEPFGMKGSRLVSDIFSDSKTATANRRLIPLLLLGDKLLWVSGLRTSRHYCVGPATRDILKISLS